MSEHGVYRRVFLPSILVDVEFEADCSRSNFGDKMARFSIGVVHGCGPSGPILVYRNSEFYQKFEVRMK